MAEKHEEFLVTDYKKIQESWLEFIKTPYSIECTDVDKSISSTPECFKFYWLEIVEYMKSRPGLLYVFGKTYCFDKKQYLSCALAIKYVHKRLYLLPRQFFLSDSTRKVTYEDVIKEFCTVIGPSIEVYNCTIRRVNKKYAFDEKIPYDTEYIEIKCRVGTYKCVINEGETYSKVLGSDVGYANTFLLERGIRGPGWLSIKNYKYSKPKTTNCDIEITCADIEEVYPENIQITPAIRLLTIDFQMIPAELNKPIEIASCSILVEDISSTNEDPQVYSNHTFVLSKAPEREVDEVLQKMYSDTTNVKSVSSERRFFIQILRIIKSYNPDIIFGYEIQKMINLLYSKITFHQLQEMSKSLSKINMTNFPVHQYMMDLVNGRVLCDIKTLAPGMVKSKTFSLEELTTEILEIPYYKMSTCEVNECLKYVARSSPLVLTNLWRVACIHKLLVKLNIIPFVFEITKLCGNTLNKTCQGFVSNRCEYLLLHAFYNDNFIIPRIKKVESGTYRGGLVLEAKSGLYREFVLAMDFNSLYPSIIMEYDVCFKTMNENGDFRICPENDEVNTGIIPKIVKHLVKVRNDLISRLAAETPKGQQIIQIKQNVIKIIANSVYGYLACDRSRFYGPHLSAFIALKGREILTSTVKLVENKAYPVIYGDTDSIMINTGFKTYEEVINLRTDLTTAINSRYNNIVISGAAIYNPFYLLKKKKYAGVNYLSREYTEKHIKGIELVRRDWSAISADIVKYILDLILSDEENIAPTIYYYLSTKHRELNNNYGNCPSNLFTITKKLSKNPNDYTTRILPSHVKVARRYNCCHEIELEMGDYVTYVVCKDGTNEPASNRMYHITEFDSSTELRIDIQYYIREQIYPVIIRLCEPIPAIRAVDIESALCFDLMGDDDEYVLQEVSTGKRPRLERVIHREQLVQKTKYLTLTCLKCDKQVIIQYKNLLFYQRCNDCPTTNDAEPLIQVKCLLTYLLHNFNTLGLTLTDAFDIRYRLKEELINMKLSHCIPRVDVLYEFIIRKTRCLGGITISQICDKPDVRF